MRLQQKARNLSSDEQALATRVFGPTLPAWSKIYVNDGLGLKDCPFTDNPSDLYNIWIGPLAYPDCTSKTVWPGFGPIDAVFVHEMTHVWQYFHGYNVKLSSVWGQSFGDGYGITPGPSWNDMNVEQEATIVEDWYKKGDDDRFQYVQKVVRLGGGDGASKTLAQLKAWAP